MSDEINYKSTANKLKDYVYMVRDLELVELSGIDDKGNFIRNIDISILENAHYGCGLFWFRKWN